MAKKIVAGGPIRFKEDLPLRAEDVARPLGLKLEGLLPQGLSLPYKGWLFQLVRRPADSWARVWGQNFGLEPLGAIGALESVLVAGRRADVEQAQREWLRGVLGGASVDEAATRWGAVGARLIKEKVLELCVLPQRATRGRVGTGQIRWAAEASAMASMVGYERVLLVDGKVYELLTLAEYVARFERAFEPDFFADVQSMCASLDPAGLCDMMRHNLDRMDKRTYSVIRGKVHFDRRTFELQLDGVYFVPEFVCRRDEFATGYEQAMERALKLEAVQILINEGGE